MRSALSAWTSITSLTGKGFLVVEKRSDIRVQIAKKSRCEPRVFKLLLNSLRADLVSPECEDPGFGLCASRGDRQSGNPFDTMDRAIHRAVVRELPRQRTRAYWEDERVTRTEKLSLRRLSTKRDSLLPNRCFVTALKSCYTDKLLFLVTTYKKGQLDENKCHSYYTC